MKTGQGFLLVFSITSLSSLAELHELRDQILRIKDDAHVPLVLVGNKSDLEEDRAVTRTRAFSVSQSWGRIPYYETSARRRANVDEVFRDLCRQIIRRDMQLEKILHPPRPNRRTDKGGKKSIRNKSRTRSGRKGDRSSTCVIL